MFVGIGLLLMVLSLIVFDDRDALSTIMKLAAAVAAACGLALVILGRKEDFALAQPGAN